MGYLRCIDPRYTDTAATFIDQWTPIGAGADTAILIAAAHTIAEENVKDQAFLEKVVTGEPFQGPLQMPFLPGFHQGVEPGRRPFQTTPGSRAGRLPRPRLWK